MATPKIKKAFDRTKKEVAKGICNMCNGTRQVETWINGMWAAYKCPKCNGTGYYNET